MFFSFPQEDDGKMAINGGWGHRKEKDGVKSIQEYFFSMSSSEKEKMSFLDGQPL